VTGASATAERALAHHRARNRRKSLFLAAALSLLLISVMVDLLVGPAMRGAGEVINALVSPASRSGTAGVIVWTLRLPMSLMAVVVGMALGVAGAEAQTILDNPIADPYTLGLSAAAGFGAALAILFGAGVPLDPLYAAPACAFLCCGIGCGIVYVVAKLRGAHTEVMVLAGIAVLFLFQALLTLLQYQASPEVLQAIVFWLFGSLARASWAKVGFVAVLLVVVLPLLAADAWRLTALRLGEERARALGIGVEALRLRMLIWISILTAIAVCFVGTIGFVGLIAPHIARFLVGEDQRFFLPLAGLVGGILLSAASIVSKAIVPGAVYPLGIVTALVGVPFFFALILRARRVLA
jgi:iron complex transport system permease protein